MLTYEVVYVEDGSLRCKDFRYEENTGVIDHMSIPPKVMDFLDEIKGSEWYLYVLDGESLCTHFNVNKGKKKRQQK